MSLFESVQKEHVLKAIKQLDINGLSGFPSSKYYDVKFEDKTYPPKPIMVIAAKLATGQTIKTTDFSGGIGTPAFNKLTALGFNIIKKVSSSFISEVHNFLNQAKTDNLKTKDYQSSYKDLKVKVSFGQGGVARIPWISFLGEGQTTSEGIYPVYLYFKREEKLILAYGLSETNIPVISWDLVNAQTIKEYFADQGMKPDRYGDSYVFKIYDTLNLPEDEVLDNDLNELITKYKNVLGNVETSINKETELIRFDYLSFLENQVNAGLLYQEILNQRFIASILTKPFVILTGLSGSGKTKLAQSFVEWICQSDDQYELIPVGADWTNREPLLGFPNALEQSNYVMPDSKALQLILRAIGDSDRPYFLILDEMNLSHVERYFADFLSVMESKGKINLHSSESCNYPPQEIGIPENLFIIGTVNIDETTYMFSPKVLDRANTIEFRVTTDEMSSFLKQDRNVDMSKLRSKGASMAKDFIVRSKFKSGEVDGEVNNVLLAFFEVLQKAGAEFGYRTANEIRVLITQLQSLDASLKPQKKLDIAIMQKLLPKLHGSRRKLEDNLRALCTLCLEAKETVNVEDYLTGKIKDLQQDKVRYPISMEKIQRMYRSSVDHGFASYAEA